MKKSRNHTLHFCLILIMLLISGIAMQIPVTRNKYNSDYECRTDVDSSINNRIQSLVYTGNIDSIVDGIARYFVGSMPDALTAFLHMKESPLQKNEKTAILFGLIHKLRKHKIDQALVCKRLVETYSQLSSEPLLYAAVKSSYPVIVKDIVQWSTDYNYTPMNNVIFEAFNYAVKNNDLKSIEKMHLHGAELCQADASRLLKMVIGENKKIEIAKFFIDRTSADLYYVNDKNKSLLT